MKKFFTVIKLTLFVFVGLSIAEGCSPSKNGTSNQAHLSLAEVQNMVDAHQFKFVAETVNPLRGRFRTLTSPYDVTVSRDTVTAYLPYYGRAYTAPLDPSEGGIKFTSTNFSYDVSHSKSDKWNVLIKPGAGQDVRQLNFTIFSTGAATLSVNSNSKEPISFNGHIEK
ncbi:MAG: DUF4251 domain-containing protein [Ginsengibacter sp.]